MPKAQRAGFVYKTVAIPQVAYDRIDAYAKRLHLPITQAVGLILNVATGPHGIVMTAQEADAEAARLAAEPDALTQLVTARKDRRRDLGGTHKKAV